MREPVYLRRCRLCSNAIPRPRSSGRTWGLAGSSSPCACRRAAERDPGHIAMVEAMVADPAFKSRELRHLLGRGREIRRRIRKTIDDDGDCSIDIPTDSSSGPTPWRPTDPSHTTRCTTCGRRCSRTRRRRRRRKIRKGNYERLFDEARKSVREWERTHVK